MKPDFNTHDAFRIFDIDNLGRVTAIDLSHGLADIGVHVTVDDVNLFIQRYDRNRDGFRFVFDLEILSYLRADDVLLGDIAGGEGVS